MGSWVRTITSPFRKACTILNPQGRDHHHHRANNKTPRHHPPSGTAMVAHGGGAGDAERTSQLYGDVMACAYDDVQVMWSLLDNKARICNATS